MEDRITQYAFDKECEDIAREIASEIELDEGETLADYRDEMADRASETIDGHQWVIYHYKSLKICADLHTDEGEEFLEEFGMPETPTIYNLASTIVYGQMRYQVEQAIDELIKENAAA